MSEQEFHIKWRRDNEKPRPEDQMDVNTRKEAVQELFDDIGVDKDEYRIEPTNRLLGGDLPYFVIANIVIDSVSTAILVKKYIENQGDDAVVEDDVKERLDNEYEEQFKQ